MTRSANRPPPLEDRFASVLAKLNFRPKSSWAIAVSGGGDSVALMHLAAGWANASHLLPPVVLTVDHGLRPESGRDAARVKAWAEACGLKAVVLRWAGAKPHTAVEEQARIARHKLMGDWCSQQNTDWLLLGHTKDDQAENFLLRLGRGSGVDGLSAMQAAIPLPARAAPAVMLMRPLLGFSRAELRCWLSGRGVIWLEDPMNDDDHFARTRVRKLLPLLADAGIPSDRIAAAAGHLGRARHALELKTREFLEQHANFDGGMALMDGAALRDAPREIGLRALSEALRSIGKISYRPRFERLERLFEAVVSNDFKAGTLAGCRLVRAPKSRAAFGPRTIAIALESPRKSRRRAPAP
ncbi:MAG TPA: tRNA lysidine(34) synthetase TilS [Micropepsaceae bacterium]|nr:tRNA lysidine(34) synthetase TilS [Micropepsaceae bacterium]